MISKFSFTCNALFIVISLVSLCKLWGSKCNERLCQGCNSDMVLWYSLIYYCIHHLFHSFVWKSYIFFEFQIIIPYLFCPSNWLFFFKLMLLESDINVHETWLIVNIGSDILQEWLPCLKGFISFWWLCIMILCTNLDGWNFNSLFYVHWY